MLVWCWKWIIYHECTQGILVYTPSLNKVRKVGMSRNAQVYAVIGSKVEFCSTSSLKLDYSMASDKSYSLIQEEPWLPSGLSSGLPSRLSRRLPCGLPSGLSRGLPCGHLSGRQIELPKPCGPPGWLAKGPPSELPGDLPSGLDT